MKETRILYVIHAPKWGGLHTLVERLAPLCAARGYPWTVVLPDEADDNGAERLEAAGIRTITIPLRRIRKSRNLLVQAKFLSSIPGDIWRLHRLIESEGADIVQIGGLIHFHGVLAARLARRAVVWQLHSDQPPRLLRRFFTPWVVRLADTAMTSGRGIVRSHPGLETLGPRLIPFLAPVDTARFRPDPEKRREARARMDVKEGEILVATVGGRGPNKNHAMLVEVAAALRNETPRLVYRICGTPLAQHQDYYERDVIGRADALGLVDDGTIRFEQPGTQVDLYMAGFDIFVLPSHAEGISLVTAEAMSSGVPVVVNDVGSLADLVADGEYGFLNRSRTVEEMTRHILALAQDPDLRSDMGKKARAFAETKLSETACAELHIAAYRLALAHRRGERIQAPDAEPAV